MYITVCGKYTDGLLKRPLLSLVISSVRKVLQTNYVYNKDLCLDDMLPFVFIVHKWGFEKVSGHGLNEIITFKKECFH